jgi:cardiolipin synthase
LINHRNAEIKDMQLTGEIDFRYYSDPLKFYMAMLEDISQAKKSIYLEMYKFAHDVIGEKFRDAITRKSKEGLQIKLLVDAWGTSSSGGFFAEMIRNGAEVRFFKKLKWSYNWLARHHSRNHRKILIIDDEITYFGSANITAYSLNWRELVIRMKGPITRIFKRSFLESRRIYNKLYFNTKTYSGMKLFQDFRLMRDVPSITRQRIKKKFEDLIKSAKSEIIIETPYFLPGYMLRKYLMDASRRGVNVYIITPKQSDVTIVDVLRSKYLGLLHKSGINLRFYQPYNLHAKLVLIDQEIFAVGSSNFDYRSFRYMHELMLFGKDKAMVEGFQQHVKETLEECETFDYPKWLRRPLFHKVFEFLLVPLRHFL